MSWLLGLLLLPVRLAAQGIELARLDKRLAEMRAAAEAIDHDGIAEAVREQAELLLRRD